MRSTSFYVLVIVALLFTLDSQGQCVGNVTYTSTPGPYANGDVVSICVNIDGYNQLSANWIHGYEFNLGSAFDPNSIVITQYPPGGTGVWGYYTSVTSSATGQTFGPGVFYDQGGDLNPGNNYGYNCNGCPSSICFDVTVVDATGVLQLWVNITGDGESGSWGGGTGDCPQDEADDLGVQVIGGNPPCNFTVTPVGDNPTCTGSDGSVTLTLANGVAPYTFVWSDGSTTQTLSNASAGTYTVTATDGTGCVDNASSTLTGDFTTAPSISFSTTNPHCDNTSGQVVANATSTTSNTFTYYWSFNPSETSNTLSNLGQGTYDVVVTDGNGCSATDNTTLTIVESSSVSAQVIVPVYCNGYCDGQANATSLTGTPPFSFSWSNGATDPSATALCSGTWTVTMTDSHQCTSTADVTIDNPPAIVLLFGTTPVSCFGESDGKAWVNVQNGTPTYYYLWSNQQTDDSLINVTANDYYVTVTDVHSCSATGSVTVVQPLPMLMAFDAHSVKCYNGSDGWVEAAVVQGTPPYTFQWNDANTTTTQDLAGVPVGTYTLKVTDASGCTVDSSVTVIQPDSISVTFSNYPSSCPLVADGIDSVTAFGGTPGYNFVWNTVPQTIGAVAENLLTGTYTVTVTDANNCVYVDSTFVDALPLFLAHAEDDKDVVRGYMTFVTATTDSDGFYGYSWLPTDAVNDPYGQTTTVMPDSTTTYTVMITDLSTGCQATDTIVVTVTPNPNLMVPNAFSPNGDGRNDMFHPFPGDGITIKSFNVFNRWGERMFNEDWFPGWDGTHNGKPCPLGVYVWYCDYEVTADGTHLRKQGSVLLMR